MMKPAPLFFFISINPPGPLCILNFLSGLRPATEKLKMKIFIPPRPLRIPPPLPPPHSVICSHPPPPLPTVGSGGEWEGGGKNSPPSAAAFLRANRAAPPPALGAGGAIPPLCLPPHCQLLAVVGRGKGVGAALPGRAKRCSHPPPWAPSSPHLWWGGYSAPQEPMEAPSGGLQGGVRGGGAAAGSCMATPPHHLPPLIASVPPCVARGGMHPPPNWLRQWGDASPPPPRKCRAPPTPMWWGGEPVGEGGCFSRAARADALAEPMKGGGGASPPRPPPTPPPSPPYYAYSRGRGRACIPPPLRGGVGGREQGGCKGGAVRPPRFAIFTE
nr:hypothetical protein [Morchella crassipes]